MTATITYDQMERDADRALALALWVRHVRSLLTGIPLFAVLHRSLRGLVGSLSRAERLESLSDQQVSELAARLRELHDQLTHVLDYRGMQALRSKPVFSSLIASLEEDTEDLYDIIENLVLSSNKDFRNLISGCVQHITTVEQAEAVGHLQG